SLPWGKKRAVQEPVAYKWIKMKLVIRELFRAMSIGLGVFLLSLMYFFLEGRELDPPHLWTVFWDNSVVAASLYLCNSSAIILMMRRYGKELFTKKYIAYGILANIGASLVGVFVSRFINLVLVQNIPWEQFMGQERANQYITPFLIAIGVALLIYAAYYYKNFKEKQVKEQKIIAGSASARFDALKNQLDPHFLFNSLNVLTSLIEEDPEQAQKF